MAGGAPGPRLQGSGGGGVSGVHPFGLRPPLGLELALALHCPPLPAKCLSPLVGRLRNALPWLRAGKRWGRKRECPGCPHTAPEGSLPRGRTRPDQICPEQSSAEGSSSRGPRLEPRLRTPGACPPGDSAGAWTLSEPDAHGSVRQLAASHGARQAGAQWTFPVPTLGLPGLRLGCGPGQAHFWAGGA